MKALNRVLLALFSLAACIHDISAEEVTILPQQTVIASSDTVTTGGYRVYDQASFKGKYNTLADFMQSVSGIQVNQTRSLGDPVLVSIQGASSAHTKLYINSVPVNNSQFGNYDLNRIPLTQIESIEILTDHANPELGNAIGGIININTVSTEINNQHHIATSIGSYDSKSIAATIALSHQSRLDLSHEQTSNEFDAEIPSPWNDSQNRNDVQPIRNNQYQKTSIRGNFSGESTQLTGSFQEEINHLPDFQRNNPNNNATLKTQISTFDIDGSLPDIPMTSGTLYNRWKLAYKYSDESYTDTSGSIGLGEDNNRYYTSFYNASWTSGLDYKNYSLGAYVKHSEEHFTSHYLNDEDAVLCSNLAGNCNQMANQKISTLSVSGDWHSPGYQYKISAWSGLERIKNFNRIQSISASRESTSKIFNTHLIKVTSTTRWADISLSFKKAIKAPTLFELFGNRGLLLNNSDLKPEQADTISLSLDHQSSAYGTANIIIFERKLKNAIVPIYDSRGIGRYENTSSADLIGAEWLIAQSFSQMGLKLSGSHYHSKTQSASVKSFRNKSLAGIYHHNIQASLNQHWENHQIRWDYNFSDELFIDRSNLIKADKKSVFDVSYIYSQKNLTASLSINNITDKKYLDFTYRPAQGRWISARISYSF